MHVKRITAILLVDDVEASARFWTGSLGFEQTTAVPDGDGLAFVALQKDGTEIMYQSYASVARDHPHPDMLARKGPAFLYIEVDDLAATMAAAAGAEIVMPERTTFYGAKEVGIREPGGHFVTFAQFGGSLEH